MYLELLCKIACPVVAVEGGVGWEQLCRFDIDYRERFARDASYIIITPF